MDVKPTRPDIQIGTKIYYSYDTRTWIVVGETSRSWLVKPEGSPAPTPWNPAKKLPKTKLPQYWTFVEQEWLDSWFVSKHKHKIIRHLEYQSTPTQIRQIAALIGYEPEENGK